MHEFLVGLFGDDLHAKRVLSLSLAMLGVIHAASLSVYAIGQALAVAQGKKGKHGVKQVDRLLGSGSHTEQGGRPPGNVRGLDDVLLAPAR